MHEAEASLRTEIKGNAAELQAVMEDVRKEQEVLKQDVTVLNRIIANPRTPNRESMEIKYRIRSFNDVSWRTAQATGAFTYMPYSEAQEYSDIYDLQSGIDAAERQGVRDTVIAVGPFPTLSRAIRTRQETRR